MFIGQYKYNIDEKGRIVIPNEYRKQLGQTVIINKGIENCIAIYKESEWNKLVEIVTSLPFNNCDNRGKVNIDSILLEHACIKKECVLVGCGNAIEIWSKESWESQEKMRQEEYDEISDRIEFRNI